MECLADENVEVREMASKTLAGVVRCSQRQSIIPLKVCLSKSINMMIASEQYYRIVLFLWPTNLHFRPGVTPVMQMHYALCIPRSWVYVRSSRVYLIQWNLGCRR